MPSFKIESGIPMPKLSRGRIASTQFPLADMKPGDPKDKKALESWRRKVLAAKKRYKANNEGDFRTVTVSEGLRVWCTE
jgi:hypothetical protein